MSFLNTSKELLKEYKTRHNWFGKVINWKLYKILKFDQADYAHKPESIIENELHKILWGFGIQMDQSINPIKTAIPSIK